MNRILNRNLICGTVLVLALGIASCTKKGGSSGSRELNLTSSAKIKGLDPIQAGDLYAGRQVANAYEPLFQYHYLKRPYELIPALAESMPTFESSSGSAASTVLKVRLKRAVLFQDDECFKASNGKGRELTADDIVYSFMRLADRKENAEGWWIFDGKIKGLNEWRDATPAGKNGDYSAKIEGLKALDRYTVRIELTKPNNQFLYYLAMPFTSIVPKEAVEHYGADFLRNPVGTGPFKLVREESNLNSKLVWVRNPTYRQEMYPTEGEPDDKAKGLLEDAGKQLPLVDKMIVQVIPEDQPRWLNFQSGKLDLTGIPKDNFDSTISADMDLNAEMMKKGIVLHKAPNLDVTYTSFNMEDPIVGKNKWLRKAMSLAYDINPVIKLFYNGRAIPAQSPIPPGVFGYSSQYRNPNVDYNIEKAKEFLAKAGYPGGKGLGTITLLGLSTSQARQQSEYFVNSMSKIGINVVVKAFTWPDFLKNMNDKKGQMWGLAWGADYPDAENFLQLFYGKNKAPGPNNANYVNSDYDRLYKEMLNLQNGEKRLEVIKKMVKIVEDDVPWVFGTHRIGFTLAQPWLRNYKVIEFDHNQEKYLNIDVARRSQGL